MCQLPSISIDSSSYSKIANIIIYHSRIIHFTLLIKLFARGNKITFHNRAHVFFPAPSCNIIFSKLASQRECIGFTKITLSRVAAQQYPTQPNDDYPLRTRVIYD